MDGRTDWGAINKSAFKVCTHVFDWKRSTREQFVYLKHSQVFYGRLICLLLSHQKRRLQLIYKLSISETDLVDCRIPEVINLNILTLNYKLLYTSSVLDIFTTAHRRAWLSTYQAINASRYQTLIYEISFYCICPFTDVQTSV